MCTCLQVSLFPLTTRFLESTAVRGMAMRSSGVWSKMLVLRGSLYRLFLLPHSVLLSVCLSINLSLFLFTCTSVRACVRTHLCVCVCVCVRARARACLCFFVYIMCTGMLLLAHACMGYHCARLHAHACMRMAACILGGDTPERARTPSPQPQSFHRHLSINTTITSTTLSLPTQPSPSAPPP